MNFKESKLISEIETYREYDETLKNCVSETQISLKNIDNGLANNIAAIEESISHDLAEKKNAIKNKYRELINNEKAELVNTKNALDASKEDREYDVLLDIQDDIEKLDGLEERALNLESTISNTMGYKAYNALLEVFDNRIDAELSFENSADCLELIGSFDNVENYFSNINPVHPESGLVHLIKLLLKPYLLIRNSFKDIESRRVIDLACIDLLLFSIISYPAVALTLIVTYTSIAFITTYIFNKRVYSKFNDYYLLINGIKDLSEKYKTLCLEERTADIQEEILSKKEKAELLCTNRINKYEEEELKELDVLSDTSTVKDKVARMTRDFKESSLMQKEAITTKMNNKIQILREKLKEQDDKIKILKREATMIPWNEQIYSGNIEKPGTEVNHISGYPELIIGLKSNTDYDFDIIHTIPFKDTSYLVIHRKDNIDIVNDTILLNIVNSYLYYKPKLLNTTMIDTVSLGRKIASLDINKDYLKVITSEDKYSEFKETFEKSISDKNTTILKEAQNIYEYNKLIKQRSGILLPYNIIYVYNTQDTKTSDFIRKCAIQESIGITTIVLTELPVFKENASDAADFEKFKETFHFVIDCSNDVITITNNKAPSGDLKTKNILDI